jgi:hypothetical protein
MTSGMADAVAAPQEPKPNPFARMAGVFFSPIETFASIARKPDWVVPLIVLLIISIASSIVFAQRVDFMAAARQQMEARKDISPEQMERGLKVAGAIGKTFTYFSPLIAVIVWVIVAAVLLLSSRLFGGEGDFKQAFSTTLYGWLPDVVKGIVLTIVIAVKPHIDAMQIPTLVRSNLGFLVSPKTQPMSFALLSSIDLFTIWTLALFIIGFAAFSRLSKARAATIVISLWVVTVLFRLVPAAIQAVRMKG